MWDRMEPQPEQPSPVLFGKGMIIGIIGIVILLVALLAAGMMQSGPGTAVAPAACGEKALTYVNSNLVQAGTSATLVSTTETSGMYELKILYQSQEGTLYASKDCKLLFTSAVDMAAASLPQTPQPTQIPAKSARPAVDLYVMAFCPYGTQAENVMSPVVDLLRAKADIRVRYITTIAGTTADSVDSLHGPSEAKEDLRQICINSLYPDKFWNYLDSFDANCYPTWQDPASLEACRKNTTAALGMDSAKIDACATGAAGLGLLSTDEAAANAAGAYASPTLIINGVKYTGARNPEAFKQAICNSFETAPAECSTVLSSTSAAASGGCG
jgi:hypothetical protein